MILDEVRPFQKDVVTQLVDGHWRPAKDGRNGLETIWEECLFAFLSEHSPKVRFAPGRSRRYLPLTHEGITTIDAEILTQLLPFEEFFTIDSDEDAPPGAAEAATAEILYWLERIKFRKVAKPLVMQAAILGTSPFELSWHQRWKLTTRGLNITAGDPDGQMGSAGFAQDVRLLAKDGAKLKFQPDRDYEMISDGPRLLVLDLFDTVYDLNAPATDDLNDIWRINRRRVSAAELMRMGQEFPGGYHVYENIDRIQRESEAGDTESGDSNQEIRLQALGISPSARHDAPGVDVKEFQGDFTLQIEGEVKLYENVLVVVANDETLLRFEDNPRPRGRLPIQQLVYSPSGILNQVYGIGAVQPALGIESAANATLNQTIDIAGKIIKGQSTVRRQYADQIDLEALESGVSPFVFVRDHEDIQPVKWSAQAMDLVPLIGMFRQFHETAMGQPRNLTTEQYQKTATEIAQIGGQVQVRFKDLIADFEEGWLEPLLKDLLVLRGEFGPQGEIVRRRAPESMKGSMAMDQGQVSEPGPDQNQDWIDVPPEVFDLHFRIHCRGSGLASQKVERLASIHQFLQSMALLPQHMLTRVDWGTVLRMIWNESVGGDASKVILPPNPVEELIAKIGAEGQGGAADGGQDQGQGGQDTERVLGLLGG